MKFFKIYFTVFCLSTVCAAQAQQLPLLGLKDAVEIALKNNFNIRLSKNNIAITQNNVTRGNAGMLPQIAAAITSVNSIQDTKQTKADGTTPTKNGVLNSSLNYGVNLNWTIFNGFAMFANYDQLKQLNQLSEVAARDTIERTMAQVIYTYYNLVNQNQQIKAIRGAIEISKTQLRYANDKFTVGRASGLDVLNAQVNVNSDTSNLITQIQRYRTAKIRMNQLLVRDLQTDFMVTDTIIIDDKLILGDILNQAQSQNPVILSSQINRQLAEINLRQVKATRYPTVGITSGYNFNDSKSPAGIFLQQNTRGFNYGLSASVNLFDGLNQARKERNAKIQIDNANINLSKTQQNIEAEISNLYINYLSGLDLVRLNQSNIAVAKRNLKISLEKYKLGNITPLAIREAQKSYLDAESRYFEAQYQAKTAEVNLKELINNINIQ